MRLYDEDKFNKTYSSESGESVDVRFADSLGLSLKAKRHLAKQIFDDLDEEVGGVGWWHDHLDHRRRMLISDYLYCCIDSIETNLVEAKLHLLGFMYENMEINKSVEHSMSTTSDGRIFTRPPIHSTPKDELPSKLIELHICGFFRAIGSAVDCLGESIIGVAGLPLPIYTASYRSATNNLASKSKNSGGSISHAIHKTLLDKLLLSEKSSGPADWIPWTTSYRNMLVHRARRMAILPLVPSDPILFGPNGMPALRARAIRLLPRDPELSEIESLVQTGKKGSKPFILEESAETTLSGILQSTFAHIQASCKSLQDVWMQRRESPSAIIQPERQWPLLRLELTNTFDGYSPGSSPFDMRQMFASPSVLKRLLSSHVTIDKSVVWRQPHD